MFDNIEVYTLFSGSKGNSVYIRAGDTRILIDAGCNMKTLEGALNKAGASLSCIDGIFITHEHSDHVNSLPVVMKKHGIPVHMTERTAAAFLRKYAPIDNTIIIHPARYEFTVGNISLRSFITPHDSEESVGYIINMQVHNECHTIGLATDIGCITKEMYNELIACESVIVESNYDAEMLKNGPYPYYLKKRIASKTGHLSNDKCSELVVMLAQNGVKRFMLAHLSEENNRPAVALRASCDALCRCGLTDVKISVADRYLPTGLLCKVD